MPRMVPPRELTRIVLFLTVAERAISAHESKKAKSAHLSCSRCGCGLADRRNQLAGRMVRCAAEAVIQSSKLGVPANLNRSVCDNSNRRMAHLPTGD